MAKQTVRERLIEALEARGERRIKQTAKYDVYTCGTFDWAMPNPNRKIFIGKMGAVRVGNTVSNSISSDRTRNALLGINKVAS